VLNISDLPPLAKFVPLIGRMNPIFLIPQDVLHFFPTYKMMEGTLNLLKVSFVPS
jgi:hypothetical protein